MEKSYQPHAIEKRWLEFWNNNEFAKPKGSGKPYCIMLPPPNVTGTLHMGHGFQISLMDALVRKHRMQGDNVHWQVGSDHAGIATQMVVERQLAKEGKTRHDLGREAFINHTWRWKEHSGNIIMQQIRRMGASVDWSRERFSMDTGFIKAVNTVFCQLHEAGLIYRGKRLVNWDPILNTALSDLEVINTPTPGHLWTITYPIVGSEGYIPIATTRPETLLGDTAVAVHPEDKRYKHLIGKLIKLPLSDREIPIIADDYVDPEFGTGCVKITPAHDFNDHAMGQRHQLPMINIMRLDGHLNENVPKAYQGLSVQEARQAVLQHLKEQNLLIKTEDHELQVPRGDRSGAIIEPLLTDQWFMKTESIAKDALSCVKEGQIQFIPDNWRNTYNRWLENIQDWCISRQLWWGHRIPAWYDNEGQIYVGESETHVREKYKLTANIDLRQDEDVLDTWFSASLWPFATLGWPNKTIDFSQFYPTSTLVTGFDIIFFWVARMIMMGLKFTKKVPFNQVYITGLIRDQFGNKMSKSKGNVLDPLDLIDGIALDQLVEKRSSNLMQEHMREQVIEKTTQSFPNGIKAHGTDALRFCFCALANTGRDINFDMGRMEGYRHFCNKLWNAARFVLMQTEDQLIASTHSKHIVDRWIQSALQHTTQQVEHAFKQYRFDLIAQHLYDFFWNQFCDWYLEFSKIRLNDPTINEQDKQQTRYTLLATLESYLRLSHPIMPFITEEIWQRIKGKLSIDGQTIMLSPYPKQDSALIDHQADKQVAWLQSCTTAIRTMRSELKISPKTKIRCLFNGGTDVDSSNLESIGSYLISLCQCECVQWLNNNEVTDEQMATHVVGQLQIQIPVTGLIDVAAETQRLEKEIKKIEKDQEKRQQKLNNPNYINKAPKTVVETERERSRQAEDTLEKLRKQLKSTLKMA